MSEPVTHPFRFGVGPGGFRAGGRAEWRDTARRLEDLGYDTVCFGDHFDTRPAPGPLAVACALWTERIRFAVHVYANDFRHPALLAQEVATIATLTDGRFDAGVGAGWMTSDYATTGLQLDPPGVRIDRLREAVQILKASLGGGQVTFSGHYYTVEHLPGAAAWAEGRRPRIVLGGGGRRMLRLAAEEADVVSINLTLASGLIEPAEGHSGTAAATREKLALIREHAGDRFDDLELQVQTRYVEVSDDGARALRRAAAALTLSEPDAARSPHVLVGSVDTICERLLASREEFGFSYVCLNADAATNFAPVVARLAGS